MAQLKDMKGLTDKERALLIDAEKMLGPEPATMGFAKNLYWGRVREELLFPYPDMIAENEKKACAQLLVTLEDYLRNEHPSIEIDQDQHIPDWCVKRLFDMGVLGITIGVEYGGLGMGITSYNRVLQMIGKYCGSTAVMVSAHQSIGCKALMLFGTDAQKKELLPKLATEWLSAFCLSEPNVGCDAGGQETRCELSADGTHYVLNGEKKWATSGALAGMFTVMAKHTMPDGKEKVTSLICTPDMPGIDIFQKNRSKCGIRGTWQARIRFTDVKVPKENLLHKEGQGLKVALTCLNFGRCTLSAGMLGGAQRAMDQAIRWAKTRYQFGGPLADNELVRERIAHMAALSYGMDAVLYATTGFLDRHDEDIMVETAICKVFCSEMGWRVVNDAVQIMGGESYMTENEIERIFRDSRINTIVEGSNDLMWSFIFGYGGKQLAEWMLGLQEKAKTSPLSTLKPAFMKQAIPVGLEVFLGVRKRTPIIGALHASLTKEGIRASKLVRELTYQFKQTSKRYDAAMMHRQSVQTRLALASIWLHAWLCSLSKLDAQVRAGASGPGFVRDRAAAEHLFDLAEIAINEHFRNLYENADETMLNAADAAMAFDDTLPPDLFIIPERTPTDQKGRGRMPNQSAIKQFDGDSEYQNNRSFADAASSR